MSFDFLGLVTHTVTFNIFESITFQQLCDTVSRLKPTGSAIDMVPPWFLKEKFEVIGPSIFQIVKKSLDTGVFPSILKQAFVQPVLKKPSLDPTDLTNYRPVSHLPFLSKNLENIVFSQLHDFFRKK